MHTFIFVTAALGREVPIPAGEGTAPGGTQLRCTPGKTYRLPYSTYTRKRIAGGDLLLVNAEGLPVGSLELASAPDVVPLDETGAVIVTPKPAPAMKPATTVDAKFDAAPKGQ